MTAMALDNGRETEDTAAFNAAGAGHTARMAEGYRELKPHPLDSNKRRLVQVWSPRTTVFSEQARYLSFPCHPC